jgi:hypothetical protein
VQDLTRAELQRLVTRLTDIAYEQPQEIERMLQTEAADINANVLRNRASYAELTTRLRTAAGKGG